MRKPQPLLFLVCLLCLSWILSGCGGEATPTAAKLEGVLPVVAPEKVQAGETVSVTVGPVKAAEGVAVTLVAIGSYGPKIYRANISKGQAVFSWQARESGLVSLVATSGNARGEGKLTVVPGPAIEPVTPLVGGRAITADGEHYTMVVAVPFDSFDNPVEEGTVVQIKALHPDSRLEEIKTQTTNLLSWSRLFSGTKAGRTTVTVASGKAFGPDSVFLETAGWPVSFKLSAEPDNVPADGRSLINIKSDIIKDRFGNVMPDGTLITFIIESPNGDRRTVPSSTIKGIAETPLQAPRDPVLLKVKATVYGAESEQLTVAFTPGPAVGNIPLEVKKDTPNRVVTLSAGPLLGGLEQFVPDGTPVMFRVTDTTGQRQWFNSVANNGRASVEIRLEGLQLGNYVVDVMAGTGQGTVKFSLP
jgi:hypothetical protein